MKTPYSQKRSLDVSEKQAQRTRLKEAKKTTRTAAPPALLDGRRGDEEQLAFQAQLLANVGDAVLATDAQYRITYWNAAAERLYGYTADEVLGRLAHDVVRSEVTPEQRAAYIRELEGSGPVQVETVQYDRHGNPLATHGTCSALRASDGRILGYVAVNRDVTAKRRDEQQLRQQAELLDLTHDAVFVRDLESHITFWNRAAESLYGWTNAEAVGQPLQGLLHTHFSQPLADIEAKVKREGHWEGELLHTTRAERSIQVASRWSLQRDAQGQPIAILEINTDITERKRGEAEIRRLNAELEQRVAERTAELERTNKELKQEIVERQKIENDLREAEQKANDLIQYVPTAIYEIDFRGRRFTKVNDAMCQTTGYTREELLAKSPFDLLDEKSQRLFQARITKTQAGETVDESVEYTIKTKHGRDMCALLKTRLLHEEGNPVRAFVIAHDITERKHRELNAAFLGDIEQDLARLSSPDEIMQVVGDKMMRHFEVTRLSFAEVNEERNEVTGLYDNREQESGQPMGTQRLSDYASEVWLRDQSAGNALVVDDLTTDPRFADRAHIYEASRVRAQIIAPFVTEGRLSFVIAMQCSEPYHWRADEIELLRELAARIYPALQRARAEAALRESEERLRRALSMDTVGVIFFNLEGGIADANEAFLRMSGYGREDLSQGRARWDVMTPQEFMPSSLRAIEELFTKGETTPYEKQYIRKDGSRWWGLFAAKRLTEKENVEFILDITEHKRAEVALRASEARFRLMADSSPFMIWVTDANGDIEFVNQAYRDFFGVTLDQVQRPGGWHPLVHPEDAKAYIDAYGNAVRERKPFLAEARVLRADGEWRWVASTGNPRFSQSGDFIGHVGSSPDITERKQAEEQIKALNCDLQRRATELARANKELEAFAYSVSHDLRTPLATVVGLSRLLQQDYAVSLPEQAQRYLELVRIGAQQMDVLIQSLLGLSRLSRHALEKQPVNLTALVREALETLQKEATRPDLTVDLQELPDVAADPVLLKQVWVNLIANACKFTRKREGARIEIGFGSDEDGERVYYVRDNGVGFDMAQADRLFGVFQRLHGEDEYEGTGVGLAIVARIVQRHGGRVWAEGKVGEGATFYFTLG